MLIPYADPDLYIGFSRHMSVCLQVLCLSASRGHFFIFFFFFPDNAAPTTDLRWQTGAGYVRRKRAPGKKTKQRLNTTAGMIFICLIRLSNSFSFFRRLLVLRSHVRTSVASMKNGNHPVWRMSCISYWMLCLHRWVNSPSLMVKSWSHWASSTNSEWKSHVTHIANTTLT